MPKILPILTYKDENIRKVSQPVEDFNDPKIQELIDDLAFTMYEKDGVGLAAPQADAPYRIIAVVPDPKNFELCKKSGAEPLICINPIITHHSLIKESGEEGCLSVPTYYGIVRRWKKITATYYDRHGEKKELKTTELLARIIQHEIDHLNGILFTDRTKKLYQIKQL
ncbi:peptide deformylase [Candidatus Uhrbacteria bacterium]|nr:peptide deformylase [Candidatus Uhrbacteria bacterium]